MYLQRDTRPGLELMDDRCLKCAIEPLSILRFCAQVHFFFASDYPTVTNAFNRGRYRASDAKKSDFNTSREIYLRSFSSTSTTRITPGTYVSVASLDFTIVQVEWQSTGWPFRRVSHSLSRRHSEMGFGVERWRCEIRAERRGKEEYR